MPDPAELINRRMRQVAVHSVLYYRFNMTAISDHQFDAWCRELVDLIAKHPEVAAAHPLWFHFRDFDGSTGFHLATIPWAVDTAERLKKWAKV